MEASKAMPITPMPKNSAVDYVIDQIKELLMNNVIKPGDRLPSESELCAKLGVSRGSLRSAMKVFEALGVVDIRVGDGTYVCTSLSSESLNPLIFSLLIVKPAFADFVQFREKIELDILDLIIKDEKLIQDILPKLDNNLEKLRGLQQSGASAHEFGVNEREFHHILAGGCGNIIFETVYRFIFEFFSGSIEDSHEHQDFGALAARHHISIVNAIRTRDFSVAKAAITDSIGSWVSSVQ